MQTDEGMQALANKEAKAKKKVIIFDLDGTLANCDHRRHLVTNGNRDWTSFFDRMVEDIPNLPILRLCDDLYTQLWPIFILSARPERYRRLTENWLLDHGVGYDGLMLRQDGDHRPDHQVKSEMVDKLGRDIQFVVDDRDAVVKMWRDRGITCLQCAPGDF